MRNGVDEGLAQRGDRVFVKGEVVDADHARGMKRVLVHEGQHLLDSRQEGGIDVELAARLAGDFCVGVGVHQDFSLREAVGGAGSEQQVGGAVDGAGFARALHCQPAGDQSVFGGVVPDAHFWLLDHRLDEGGQSCCVQRLGRYVRHWRGLEGRSHFDQVLAILRLLVAGFKVELVLQHRVEGGAH